MAVNPSKFHQFNVIDTCAIWNILSSRLLYETANGAKCSFCCTYFVIYECLHKTRKNPKPEEIELQNRFRKEHASGKFKDYHLDIEDLQDVEVLQNKMKIDKGELASIAFAKKTSQAILTDDQGARKLAAQFMHQSMVQTTPHLLGWLLFKSYLSDSDMEHIINEHKKCNRPLEKYFRDIHNKVCDYKLKDQGLSL